MPPGTPGNVTVTADNEAAFVSWSAPSDGGSPIDQYKVVANGTTTVIAPCGLCTSVYFSGLSDGTTYTFQVYAHNSVGNSVLPAISPSVTPAPAQVSHPGPPQGVLAVASNLTATISWQPPVQSAGVTVDRYQVQAIDTTLTTAGSGAVYYSGLLYVCGTCSTATFSGLSAGDTYQFLVYAHSQDNGYGPAASSNLVTGADPSCPQTNICLNVDGATNDGAVAWRADGFLHGIGYSNTTAGGVTTFSYAGPDDSQVLALHPTSWRMSSCTFPAGLNDPSIPECQWAHQFTSASLTSILSDDYNSQTYSSAANGPQPPWECWSCYSHAVQAIVGNTAVNNDSPDYVKQGLAAGDVYWDIMNEPGNDLGPHQAGTTQLYLQQLSYAYNSIKTINPSLRVVAPSLSDFVDTPNPYNPHVLGFDAFLKYSAVNGLAWDAVSWHNNSGLFDDSPTIFPYLVQDVDSLEDEYGITNHPKVFVNEYGPKFANLVPGWSAGWITALEQANVDQANRSCWTEPGITNPLAEYSECGQGGSYSGTLDGLFTPPEGGPSALQPNANYWVYRFYAGMSGSRLTTTTSSQSVTAFAARDDASSTISILLGRHLSCTKAVHPQDCTVANAPEVARILTPPPAQVVIRISYPYPATSVDATIADIPNVNGPVAPPPGATQTVPVQNGQVSINLPAVADGDSYTITLVPSG
jgi:hypothetical protein